MRNLYRPRRTGASRRQFIPYALVAAFVLGGCSTNAGQGHASGSANQEGARVMTADSPSPSAGGTATSKTAAEATEPLSHPQAPESTGPATGEEQVQSDVPPPTPAEQPEAALSDDEIRETYGAGAPEPAESMVGTLCNLNRVHLEELSESMATGLQLDDQMLRLGALSLSDDLGVWEGMVWQVPEATKELEVAREVYAHWEYAIALVDAGDDQSAMAELNAAEELIQGLPAGEVGEVEC